MKKTILAILFLFFTSNAYAGVGITLHLGQADTSGSETEKTVSGVTSEKTNKTVKETFYGASIYAEGELKNGWTLGVDWVPLDIALGDGKRTDSSTGADVASEAQTGDRKASADLENLITVYTDIPLGSNGWYTNLGVKHGTITTSETLPTSSYGNATVWGAQIGIGQKRGNLKYELSYVDFESITLKSSADSTQKIDADADVLSFKISYGF